MSPKYVLHYFPATGRAEAIRLTFHAAGVQFEDKQHTFQEWAAMKSDTSKFPLNQMPTLEVDGNVICQSLAIVRYLGNEFGMYGENNEEKVVTDQIIETLNADVFSKATLIKFNKELDEEGKKEAFAKFFDGAPAKNALTFVMKLTKKTSGSFTFGCKASLADLLILSGYEFISLAYPKVLEEFPDLVALAKEVSELPNIKSYMSSRKHAPMK